MTSYYKRYTSGGHREVWDELRQLGTVTHESEWFDDVSEVVTEAMRRTRTNLELLVTRLNREGYQFFDTRDPPSNPGVPLTTPDEQSRELTVTLERMVGPMPLVLRRWIAIVGDVNFLGHHPQWPECTDAMVLEFEGRFHPYRVSHEVRIQSDLKSWKEMGADKPFILYFAPDVFHKINASGGDPYGIVLPDSNVDGTVDLGDRTLSFIEYIRLCFTWGGFPGFADLPEGLDAGMIRRLAIDLLPI